MFYDKEIKLYKKGDKTKNAIGQLVGSDPIYIKTVDADVQPISTAEVKKDYGWDIDVSFQCFYDLDDNIKIGNLIEYKNVMYEIKKIIEWDDYVHFFIGDD